jgi:hypothetical protein
LEYRFQRSVDPEKETTMPKNQINREREVGKDHFGFSLKAMLDETGWADTGAVISTALTCKLPTAQAVIRRKISPKFSSPHQSEQHSANVRGQLQMMQPSDSMPEGLQRESCPALENWIPLYRATLASTLQQF